MANRKKQRITLFPEDSGDMADIIFPIAQNSAEFSPEADSCMENIARFLSAEEKELPKIVDYSAESSSSIREENVDVVPVPKREATRKSNIPSNYVELPPRRMSRSKHTASLSNLSNMNTSPSEPLPKTKRKIRTPKTQPVSRPQSSRLLRTPSVYSQSVNDDIALITHITSHDALKSIYSLVSSKIPCSNSTSIDLSNKDKEEIQHFFQNMKKEFQEALENQLASRPITPYEATKRERIKAQNRAKELKHEEILEQKHIQEIKRVQKAHKMQRTHLKQKIRTKMQDAVKKVEKINKLEHEKREREIKEIHNQEKNLIMENIRNFYHDRIKLLKEQIDKERNEQKVLVYEHRKRLAEEQKERRTQRRRHLDEARKLLEKENEKLKIDLREAENLEEELINLYRRSKPNSLYN